MEPVISLPSVTNVNNVSLITASYPEVHGISSNYRLVRETGEEIYHSFLGVPIVRGGRVRGVLAIQNKAQRQYSE